MYESFYMNNFIAFIYLKRLEFKIIYSLTCKSSEKFIRMLILGFMAFITISHYIMYIHVYVYMYEIPLIFFKFRFSIT